MTTFGLTLSRCISSKKSRASWYLHSRDFSLFQPLSFTETNTSSYSYCYILPAQEPFLLDAWAAFTTAMPCQNSFSPAPNLL